MKIRDAVVVGLALVLVGACDDDGDEVPIRETAPAMEEPGALPRDTAPPTAEEIAAEAEEDAGEPDEANEDPEREPGSERGTVAARALGDAVYTVQIGAFSRDAAASDLVARLEAAGLPVWESEARIEGRAYRRVRVGAVTSRADARRLAEGLAERHGVSTWIVQVDPDARLPAGILERTRRALSGS